MTIFSGVEAYVADRGGRRAIKKVLIANNGIGAVKAIRSVRRWCYEMLGNEKAITFVVMATPEDMRANAEYIRMADEIVDVPGGSNNNNYANVMLIVEIAERWGVDAVWAGWGHASENPLLPNSLASSPRKIAFLGPPGKPMKALGDKIGSTIIAQSAGVPCISWNGDDLMIEYDGEGGVPQDVYDQADVKTAAQALEVCEKVGYPLMIKASEGGGGKGIRMVAASKDVETSYRQVAGEVPGSPIFVMKLAPRSRHLEVQLLADEYGEAIALNGRDCSVQRRHQKIIEEGPPVAASPDVWRSMEQAAVSLAKSVGYVNAGTVEYLYQEEDHKFFFLELNPRLQVEHPVTEMITKVNLPAAQLQVAMGIPLHMIPDVRRFYGEDPFGREGIDFSTRTPIVPEAHCIAVRITAENPDQGFRPTSGAIQELNFRSTPSVWGYFSVDSSGQVHEFADSQFGHLFASGADRQAARKNMILALKELSIRGDIRTTIEYIGDMMESDDFVNNNISTAWLDARIKSGSVGKAPPPSINAHLAVVIGGAIEAHNQSLKRQETFSSLVLKGLLPPPRHLLDISVDVELVHAGVKYMLRCSQSGPKTFTVACNDAYVQADCRTLADGGCLVVVGGRSYVVYTQVEPSGTRLSINGTTVSFTRDYDPSRLDADVAGKLTRCLVADGDHIKAGEAYAEIEVMKMCMPLKVKETGVILWMLSEGAALKPGDQLAQLTLDDPSSVKMASPFVGALEPPVATVSSPTTNKPHLLLRSSTQVLEMMMGGYHVPRPQYEGALKDLKASVCNPLLPLHEFEEVLSVLNGRLDAQLYSKLKEAADSYRAKCRTCPLSETRGEHPGPRFPAATILPLIEQHGLSLPERDRSAFLALTDSLKDITEQHAAGVAGRTVYALLTLVRQYLHVERAFACPGRVEDCLVGLRSSHSPAEMYDMCRSHEALAMKNQLLLTLLDDIGLASAQARAVAELDHGTAAFMVPVSGVPARHAGIAKDMSAFIPILTEIGSLADSSYSTVAARARSLLIEQSTPSIAQRKRRMGLAISSARSCPMEEKTQVIQSFVEEHVPVREILLDFLKDDNSRHIAAEIYIRQIYSTYSIQEYSNGMDNGLPWGAFIFSSKGGIRLSSTALGSASSTDLIHISSSMGGTSSDQLDKKWSAPPASPNLSDVESETVTEKIPASVPRYGAFGVADTFEDLDVVLPKLLEHIPQFTGSRPRSALGPINVLHIAVITGPIYKTDDAHDRGDECAEVLAPILYRHATSLNQAGVGRLTIVVGGGPGDSKSFPSICTFRSRADFAKEDLLLRHVEPSYAYNLDLARLSNFSLRLVHTSQGTGGNVHLYAGKPLHQAARAAGLSAASLNMRRYFARVVSETREFMGGEGNRYFVEKMFVEALNQLDLAIARKSAQLDPRPPPPTNNHIFINCVTPTEPDVRPTEVAAHMRQLMQRFADKISRLGITHFEMKIICRLSENTPEAPMRLVASNPTGYVVRVDSYQEVMEAGFTVFKGLSSSAGEWQGKNVHSPYPVTRPFEGRRLQALQRSDTLYCYDFVELIEHAAIQAWKDFAADRPHARITVPSSVVVSRELVVSRSGDCENGGAKNWHANELERLTLKPVDRPAGQNDVGMVAWLMTIRTPEYPAGRQLVLVANDITFQAGSFGTREDAVFLLATRFAQELGIPRLYFAANSGARIGMADSIKKKFKVSWVNPDDPTLGYEYLYLDSKDHEDLSAKGAVRCMRVPGEEDRWKIVDIIGEEGDLGVENLRGSGMIAGATATAYADIFTLTLVVGRCVGIGAYLVRLGQRAIQNASDSPIILTGYQALNTLMGGEVYSSNDQLGGIGVMLPNGVSHLTASNHLESVKAALKWLSYVPSSKCAYLPVVDITGVDMVERVIDFVPKRGQPYDPRHLIAGFHSELDARWVSGMFDKGSFTETLANWGKTVVTGRARLGGIPVGVIATDTRTQEKKVPADPADLSSQEKTCMQAGGVWFPDSAAKTAQAIQDLSHEGLPLMILANWRGFSGGQRDMFDEILKHGARIVDALVAYKQPVFVYIPPFAELRGGAWVVVDSTINSSVMEMYAASEGARGGVLEANGAASIKFRSHDLLAAAHRLDPELQQLDARVNEDASPFLEPNLRMDPQERSSVKSAIEARERKLMGVYRQLATQFADLHDTPGRMAAVGAIRKAVPWEGARSFFYWRLRRRLAEFDLRRQIAMAQQDVSLPTEASRVIQTWFEATTTEAGAAPGDWEDDKAVLAWMANSASVIHQRVSDIKYESVSEKVRELVNDSPDAVLKGLVSALDQLDPGIRRMLISKLQVD